MILSNRTLKISIKPQISENITQQRACHYIWVNKLKQMNEDHQCSPWCTFCSSWYTSAECDCIPVLIFRSGREESIFHLKRQCVIHWDTEFTKSYNQLQLIHCNMYISTWSAQNTHMPTMTYQNPVLNISSGISILL